MFSEHLESTFTPNDGSDGIDEDLGWIEEDILIVPVSQEEVLREIRKSKRKKSPGFDLITTEVLQKLPMNVITSLMHIFNSSFHLKYVPAYWKIAEIIMIPKPGKLPHEVSSYRPISLLPALSKLFERLFINRLKPIVEQKCVIPKHQFGFRNSHSTIDQVHRIIDTIENTFESKSVCSAVFLDVSQAFDKVWHPGLLFKIKKILPKQFCEVIKSYLEERFFRIKYEDAFSELKEIKAGVPQGSILSPLLYLIFTSDLLCREDHITATFADDTALLAVAETAEQSSLKVQEAVDSIVSWAKKWRIQLNSSKSTHTFYSLKKIDYSPVYISGTAIPHSNQAKYLGMTLDTRLRWKEHVKKKREELDLKSKKMYYLIGRRSKLSISNKLLLYKQILKPIWLYGLQLWGCASQSNINLIQRFQNKVLRCIVDAPWYIRSDDLHRDLNVDTVAKEIEKAAASHEGRLSRHVNEEASRLINSLQSRQRLKRKKPGDLIRR